MDQSLQAQPQAAPRLAIFGMLYQVAISWKKSVFAPHPVAHSLLSSICRAVIAEQEFLKNKLKKSNQNFFSMHVQKIAKLNESGRVVTAKGYYDVERQLRRDVQRMTISMTSMSLMMVCLALYVLQHYFGSFGVGFGALAAVLIGPMVTRLMITTVLRQFAPSFEVAVARRSRNISLGLVALFNKNRLDQRLPCLPELFDQGATQEMIVCSASLAPVPRRRSEPLTSISSYASLAISQMSECSSPSRDSPCLALIMRGGARSQREMDPNKTVLQGPEEVISELMIDRRSMLFSQPATEAEAAMKRAVSAPELGSRELRV